MVVLESVWFVSRELVVSVPLSVVSHSLYAENHWLLNAPEIEELGDHKSLDKLEDERERGTG